MQPLQHLWRALESVPGLKAVEAEWRNLLSTEHTLFRPWLVVTSELATCYPALGEGEPRPIVVHSRDDFVAISPVGEEPMALRRSDVLVHRFDALRLVREVSVALSVSGSPAPVDGTEFAWRIGTLPLQLGARPAYMAIPCDPLTLISMIDGIAVSSHQPYLLLVPTRQWVDSRVESRLSATNGAYFPICDLIHTGDDGQLLIPQISSQALGATLGVQPGAGPSGNTFQRSGEFWQLSFDGKTVFLKDTVGLGYIAQLLREPNRYVPAVTLHSVRTGLNPLAATGSSGEVLDSEARGNYEERYRTLAEDLDDARQKNDLGQIEKLETEMEQLAEVVANATGLGGRTRELSDIEKVRKSVSGAVSRDLERINNEHESLGRHLTTSISSGRIFRYAPEREIDWLT